MLFSSQLGFDLVGKATVTFALLGKLIMLYEDQSQDGSTLNKQLSLDKLLTAYSFNMAFNTPAVVYIYLKLTGNPDLFRLFSRSFLLFPTLIFGVLLTGCLFS